MLASRRNGTLYIGVTNNLEKRIYPIFGPGTRFGFILRLLNPAKHEFKLLKAFAFQLSTAKALTAVLS